MLRAPSTPGSSFLNSAHTCTSSQPSAHQPPARHTSCRYLGNTSVTRRIAATSIMFAVGVAGVAVSPLLPLPPLQGFIVRLLRIAVAALTPRAAGVLGIHRRGRRRVVAGALSSRMPFKHTNHCTSSASAALHAQFTHGGCRGRAFCSATCACSLLRCFCCCRTAVRCAPLMHPTRTARCVATVTAAASCLFRWLGDGQVAPA